MMADSVASPPVSRGVDGGEQPPPPAAAARPVIGVLGLTGRPGGRLGLCTACLGCWRPGRAARPPPGLRTAPAVRTATVIGAGLARVRVLPGPQGIEALSCRVEPWVTVQRPGHGRLRVEAAEQFARGRPVLWRSEHPGQQIVQPRPVADLPDVGEFFLGVDVEDQPPGCPDVVPLRYPAADVGWLLFPRGPRRCSDDLPGRRR